MNENIQNVFRVTNDSGNSSLSLEDIETNIFLRFREAFVKIKFILLPSIFRNVYK